MKVSILAPFAHTNSLGRALALGELCGPGLDITVYAPRGPVWPGRRAFAQATLRQIGRAAFEKIDADLIWAIKPLPQSLGLAFKISRERGLPLVLDVDDDDLSLARQFVARSLLKRLKLGFRGDSPRRIMAMESIMHETNLVTAASSAVEDVVLSRGIIPGVSSPARLRLPHPRGVGSRPSLPSLRSGVLRLGLLGTVRQHKGMDRLLEFISIHPNVRLVVLMSGLDTAMRRRLAPMGSVDIVRGTARDALETVHAVVLPQDRRGAADVQLPARFCDGLAVGRPILASPSRAMLEYRSPGIIWLDDWSDREAGEAALNRVREAGGELGLANWRLARRTISKPLLADRVRRSFEALFPMAGNGVRAMPPTNL